MRARALLLTLAAVLACASAGAETAFDREQALRISQEALGRRVGDHVLADTRGRTVRLAEYRGAPLVLSLVYTSCSHSCSIITRQLAAMVEIARDALGEDAFAVATVGFDTRNDTPDRMRAYARDQGVDEPGWRFLATDAASVAALAREVGFVWFESPKGYDHLAQVTLLDGEGRVYRQIYGDRLDPPALVEPLKELVWGRRTQGDPIGDWVDTVRLFCTLYDPATGRYRFDYSVFVGAGVGVFCLGLIATFVVRAWRESGPGGKSPPPGRA